MPVGRNVKIHSSHRADSFDIQLIAREGRDKRFAVNFQLCCRTTIFLDHGTNLGSLRSVLVPIEIERDEDFHAVVCGGFIGVTKLFLSEGIYANVQGKGINAI